MIAGPRNHEGDTVEELTSAPAKGFAVSDQTAADRRPRHDGDRHQQTAAATEPCYCVRSEGGAKRQSLSGSKSGDRSTDNTVDRSLGPAARRVCALARGTAEQAQIGGDPGVEIAHCDDHVIERVNHVTTPLQVLMAGTVREA